MIAPPAVRRSSCRLRGRLAELERLVADEGPEQVVVGHPLTLRGERGEQARATENFAAALRGRLEVPVLLFRRALHDRPRAADAVDTAEDARAAAHLLFEATSRGRAPPPA